MTDVLLTTTGRRGVRLTEDLVNSVAYLEAGPTQPQACTGGAGAPYAVGAVDIGKTLHNQGAGAMAYFTLPTAAAGLRFVFYCQNANGLRVLASAGDTIRIANVVSLAAGYVETTVVGASLILEALNETEWVAIPADLSWSVQTA
jgi:hypothetical protein